MRGLLLAIAFSLASVMPLLAADAHQHSGMTEGTKAATGSALVQTTCPVMGKPIREDLFVEQDGLEVYFCCSACPPKFKESAMKYLPAVYKQIYPQTVQVKCPVMGGPIDGKTFTEYRGQRIGFCCDNCPKKFDAAPAKYMAKLRRASTDQVRCPVTGKPINPAVSSEYEGKTTYFSSQDALAKFKADMAKYEAVLRPEVGLLAWGPTAADDLILTLTSVGDANVYKRKDLTATEYKGKTYFLKGDEGVSQFKADPAKYIKALRAKMMMRPESRFAPTPNAGHSDMPHGGMNMGGMDHGGMSHGAGHAGH